MSGYWVGTEEKDGWVNVGELRFHKGRLQQRWVNIRTPGLEWEEPLNIFRWRRSKRPPVKMQEEWRDVPSTGAEDE